MTCTTTTKRKREEDESVLSLLFLEEGVDDFLNDGYNEAEDAANIDLAADAFSSDEDDEDDEHAVCSCSFSELGPVMCKPCEALKAFALKRMPEAGPTMPTGDIDKRIPRVTVSLPLAGANAQVPARTFKTLHAKAVKAPEALDPAANKLTVVGSTLTTNSVPTKLTRKDRVARWKIKRKRMLAAPQASHYEDRRTAAKARTRVGGKFKKESNFVSVKKLYK